MEDIREQWSRTRDRLKRSLESLGYPSELGDIIADHIGSPKGMERMIGYLEYVRPTKVELVVDEMMAIKSDIDRWRERQESLKANCAYNNVMNQGLCDDEDD